MRFLLVLLTLTVATTQAQGVRQDAVTPDDLLLLYDNAVALEVDVPTGATTVALSYGSAAEPFGMATFLAQSGVTLAPTRLRVIVLFADPSVVDPCAADEAEALVIAIPHSDDGTNSHMRQKVCVPHPVKSSITGESRTVIEGSTPPLGEWTPLVFQTWLVRAGRTEQGSIDSALDLGKNLLVQVRFGDSNSTSTVIAAPLSNGELSALPAVQELIAEYGVVEGP